MCMLHDCCMTWLHDAVYGTVLRHTRPSHRHALRPRQDPLAGALATALVAADTLPVYRTMHGVRNRWASGSY